MNEILIYDDNYYYFIHGTTFWKLKNLRDDINEDDRHNVDHESAMKLIYEIFETGIKSQNEKLSYTMIKLHDFSFDVEPFLMLSKVKYSEAIGRDSHSPATYLLNCLKLYRLEADSLPYNFLIKIPKDYLETKDLDKAFPIWRGTTYKNYYDQRICYLDPRFVVGAYDTANSCFISNSGYNPYFDPSGLLLNNPYCYSYGNEFEEPSLQYMAILNFRRNLLDKGILKNMMNGMVLFQKDLANLQIKNYKNL